MQFGVFRCGVDDRVHQGALHFVAIDIVEMQVYYVHDVRHDMESFFWVLLWVVLQYTRTAYRPTSRRYRPRAEPSSVVIKGYFLLTSMDWIVVDNRPLTTLVLEYRNSATRLWKNRRAKWFL